MLDIESVYFLLHFLSFPLNTGLFHQQSIYLIPVVLLCERYAHVLIFMVEMRFLHHCWVIFQSIFLRLLENIKLNCRLRHFLSFGCNSWKTRELVCFYLRKFLIMLLSLSLLLKIGVNSFLRQKLSHIQRLNVLYIVLNWSHWF